MHQGREWFHGPVTHMSKLCAIIYCAASLLYGWPSGLAHEPSAGGAARQVAVVVVGINDVLAPIQIHIRRPILGHIACSGSAGKTITANWADVIDAAGGALSKQGNIGEGVLRLSHEYLPLSVGVQHVAIARTQPGDVHLSKCARCDPRLHGAASLRPIVDADRGRPARAQVFRAGKKDVVAVRKHEMQAATLVNRHGGKNIAEARRADRLRVD